ncbi:MAG: TIGR00730 family Rossman fold protein [Candidatus Paceibacterota bacterium]|jgi:hypothetical protein
MDKDSIQVKVEEVKLKAITEEFHQGIEVVKRFNPSVTFYGSTRITEDHPYYKKVQNLTHRIAEELGYAVLSGGGPGIMEAANRGAFEAGGKSVGLTIKLPFEQVTNPYVTDEIPFHFFFTRQSAMSYSTEVCVFCPGGFGTLNELFENLTLQQTGKIGKIPVILFGSEFWNPINQMIKETLLEKYHTVSEKDMNLYMIKDDEDEIINVIKNSAMRTGLDSLK